MFVMILLNCKVTEPKKLWDSIWEILAEDIQYRQRQLYGDSALKLNDEVLQNYTLQEIEKIFWKHNRTLKEDEFSDIPYPDMFGMDNLKKGLNTKQKIAFNEISKSFEQNDGRLFFVYGSGGIGKTYLWRTLIASLRSQGKIVLTVTSSGIASLLLLGGRTAHSRFKIPLRLNETSCCNVSKKSPLAELLCKVDLIIWDEAPMIHMNALEPVQRALADLMMETNKGKVLFGKKTLVLGGAFRKILPVTEEGTREDIVNASISISRLWKHFTVFELTENMRLSTGDASQDKRDEIEEFAKWILDVGNGKVPAISLDGSEDRDWIQIPSDLLIDYFINKRLDKEYLAERSILAPTNECVHKINSLILSSVPGKGYTYLTYHTNILFCLHLKYYYSHALSFVPGEERTYLSADSIGPESSEYHSSVVFYDKDFFNKHEESGMASHKLTLKVGVPIMLLRNLSNADGLCNGTRLIVKHLGQKYIEAEVLIGLGSGNTVFIPRIVMNTPETSFPFILHRRQFPVRICYAMTINKSQGQSLPNVGVYLEEPIFSYGQLYVSISRTIRRQGLKILIKKNGKEPDGYTQNVVFEEIFQTLLN
ncbi:hypothetical protein MKW98_018704 [Papaver atlanticum]|uniref:ATP-dependent DNA helicase n=1 Tax=Papaver atlanticum TaxID=357466 RepID=A0AAD4T586_9MAGN|nr:hypothetical protein MKW98_018704 [Papaver atlanticum]